MVDRDPDVWGGRAIICGTRIPVFALVDRFRSSGGMEDVLEAYPELSEPEVLRALAYATRHQEGIEEDRRTYREEVPPEARIGEDDD